jgi:hypothetical protein
MHSVLYDKKQIFKGTKNECFIFLLRHQGNSVYHACKYEGYEIVETKTKGEQYAKS